MALTTAQIDIIRLLSGDNCEPYLVSDDVINTLYNESDGSQCYTVTRIIEMRLADASHKVGQSGDGLTNTPLVSQINTLLDRWYNDCPEAKGNGLTGATMGYVNLGIDEETDLVDIE